MKSLRNATYKVTLLLAAIAATGCASGGGGQAAALSRVGDFMPNGLSSQSTQIATNQLSNLTSGQRLALSEDASSSGGFGLIGEAPVPYKAVSSNPSLQPLDGGKLYGHY